MHLERAINLVSSIFSFPQYRGKTDFFLVSFPWNERRELT